METVVAGQALPDLPPLPNSLRGLTNLTSTWAAPEDRLRGLDPSLAELRRAMRDLRQLDLTLLNHLVAVRENIRDYRQILNERSLDTCSECSSYFECDLDPSDDALYANIPPEYSRVGRSVSQLRDVTTPVREGRDDIYLEPVSCGKPHNGPCNSPRGQGHSRTIQNGGQSQSRFQNGGDFNAQTPDTYKRHCLSKSEDKSLTNINGKERSAISQFCTSKSGRNGAQTSSNQSPRSITSYKPPSVSRVKSPNYENINNFTPPRRNVYNGTTAALNSPRVSSARTQQKSPMITKPWSESSTGSHVFGPRGARRMSGEYDNLRDFSPAKLDLNGTFYESSC